MEFTRRGGQHSMRGRRQPPHRDIIAAEIVEDLQAALARFAEIANDLKKPAS